MYKIRFTNTALKDLKKIPPNDVNIIGRKLNEYKEDPFAFCKKLSGKDFSTYNFGNKINQLTKLTN